MTSKVTFDVGGKAFKVSKSLLDLYPNTMLAKSASQQWHSNPEQEIYIDRDYTLFRHVLSYLRDQKVSLPLTVTKEELLLELDYYNIDAYEGEIDDSLTKGIQGTLSLNHGYGRLANASKSLDVLIEDKEKEANSLKVAKQCIEKYVLQKGKKYYNQESFIFDTRFDGLIGERNKYSPNKCNECLAKVGLRLLKHKDGNRKYYEIQEIDIPPSTTTTGALLGALPMPSEHHHQEEPEQSPQEEEPQEHSSPEGEESKSSDSRSRHSRVRRAAGVPEIVHLSM